MAIISDTLLEKESNDYLKLINPGSVSGSMLDEIVHDYISYINTDYPTFGELMNFKYHFNDFDLVDLNYSQAYNKIRNEYVQKDR